MDHSHNGKGDANQCPFLNGANTTIAETSVTGWWPNTLNLDILHQHDSKSDPLEDGFDYVEEFSKGKDEEELQSRLNKLVDASFILFIICQLPQILKGILANIQGEQDSRQCIVSMMKWYCVTNVLSPSTATVKYITSLGLKNQCLHYNQ